MTSFVIVLAALIVLAEATDVCKEDAACMDKENILQCKRYHAQCGELMSIMESCPLQFSCPKNIDVCKEDAACMNKENTQECKKYHAECGAQMVIMESCPLQFTCPKITATDICKEDAPCMNEENAQECKKYQAECGERMAIAESCPLQFGCAQIALPGNVTTVSTDVCNEDGACMDKESAQECKKKHAQCGDVMAVTSECPPRFSCPISSDGTGSADASVSSSGAGLAPTMLFAFGVLMVLALQ